jgi:hypothetical protein
MGRLLGGEAPLRGRTALDLRARELLAERAVADVARCRLACFSGAGFTRELRTAERAGEVVLVDLERLYHRD